MNEQTLSPLRRSVAFACGLLSLALAAEVIEHWPGDLVGSRRDLTALRMRDLQQAWSRSGLDHADLAPPCPPPAEVVLEPADRVDAWGTELVFLCQPLAVVSAGEDGLFGTADDLSTDRIRHAVVESGAP